MAAGRKTLRRHCSQREFAQLVTTTIRAEASISIVVAEAFEALVAPQFPPLVLLVMAQRAGITVQVTLPLLMPSERLSLPPLVMILIIVVIVPLRFSDRPASDAGEGYESYGKKGSG